MQAQKDEIGHQVLLVLFSKNAFAMFNRITYFFVNVILILPKLLCSSLNENLGLCLNKKDYVGEGMSMQIKYQEIGICGLSCRLCPHFHMDTESR
ncbi:hypothetical protein JW766_05910, partial [Candidatus Dojkabacteria bacterium]|nr:hypothetical protein [Candidatus Dojkabacteria bacterium]